MASSVDITPYIFIIIFLFLFGCSKPLEITEVEVPEYKVRGSLAELKCNYKLGNGTLYSLKWYKGDRQFYQYIPANIIKKNTFIVPGVNVDVGRSDARSVVLNKVEVITSGIYRCEVITEAPLFHTKIGVGNMTIIDLPESAPVLSGAKASYHIGDRVIANCTSLNSIPAASLEWYINDKLVNHDEYLRRYNAQKDELGLETAILGINFVTTRDHFPRGQMRLKCVAKIATIYLQSQETSVVETGFFARTFVKESQFLFGNGVSSIKGGYVFVFMAILLFV